MIIIQWKKKLNGGKVGGEWGKHTEFVILLKKKLIVTLKNIENWKKQQHSVFVAFVEIF